MIRICALAVAAAFFAGTAFAGDFAHSLCGAKPWTDKEFLDDPKEFHFAIVADRTGGERKGYFGKAMDCLNLLRPAFVMSVGDLIDGGGAGEAELRRQWRELKDFVGRLEMPFFHVVGNHDIWTGFSGMSPERRLSIDLWKEQFGTNTYYNFTYKGCHFVCLNSMDEHDYYPPRTPGLSQRQLDWAAKEILARRDARWTFIFLHKPLDLSSDRWIAFERRIDMCEYSVFCGDWHNHCTAVRNGKKLYMIGTTGGGHSKSVEDDLRYGHMDSITWVTMTKKGPVVSNLALSGIHGDTIQTCATTQGWIEAPLDYPSHLSGRPEKYAGEKNSALRPAEVMEGAGYDWHFRHAMILRQGRIYESGIEKLGAAAKRVVLLGDETASEKAAEWDGAQIFDMGFKGDRTENVLWRLEQRPLEGYRPHVVVVSVGRHNTGLNSPQEIAAAKERIVAEVRAQVPSAEIVLQD
jgi:hypothetical protein